MLSLKLDEVDQGIIERLRKDARMTFVDIGKTLGVSDATIYNRVNRLTEMGVIKKFTIEVDEAALGRGTSGFILVSVKPGTVKEVSKQLVEIERINEIHEVHGSEDLIVKVEGKNLRKLRSVILKVRKIPDVVQTEFIPIFKTWKG
ncbi:MAG: Lrp/AsnC family transcriptional regulator [Candidatus Bathyarchaeota archaeon]|nr:MAG: Lrp/AsnC family transcriptional regulator [Candidatus Bathyarchaeota archaeon]